MRKTVCLLLAITLAFTTTAMLFVPRMGIEVDEAMIANGIYAHGAPWYSWKFGTVEVPIMLISYLGALKCWIYKVWFLLIPPGPVSLRLPMILVAAAALWPFFALVKRAVGKRAAWIATVLLATDTSYLLLSASDFGPTALHFLFKLAALLLLVHFAETDSRAALAGAFFLFGLALWDKAIFLWVLGGLAVAALVVFPSEVIRRLTKRNIGVAAGALSAGALPLLIYNIVRPLETLRANARLDLAILPKVRLLLSTLDGGVFFGFMTALDPGPNPGRPSSWYQSLLVSVSEWTRHPRHSLTPWALLAAGAALPFLWRTPARKPILFGLVACAATWLPMALTAGAGGAGHHVILLWPFPMLAIAAALQSAPRRLAWAAAAVLCLSNLGVTNQYYADLLHDGPAIRWTDAMDPLNRTLVDLKAPRIFAADWGILESINLLSQGRKPMFFADLTNDTSVRGMISNPEHVFVAHTAPYANNPQDRAAIEDLARREGYTEEPVATISDRNGRPTFEVFRFRKL